VKDYPIPNHETELGRFVEFHHCVTVKLDPDGLFDVEYQFMLPLHETVDSKL